MLKKNLSGYLFFILLGGLFWSRALLSIIIVIWAFVAVFQIIKTDRSFFRNTIFIWSMVPLVLWLLGAWQDPLGKSNFDYLLTLCGYPAIVLIVNSSPKKIIEKTWMNVWIIATAIALSYPFFWYFKDVAAAQHAYGTGQSLPTFMDTDHVRFSIFLCSSLLFILFTSTFSKRSKLVAGFVLLMIILFLAVRTGWLLSIIILACYTIQQFITSNRKKISTLLIGVAALSLLCISSYFIFPTMQQKIAYSIWEWNQYKPGNYDVNFSDGTRRAINFSSLKYIQTDNWINTGWQGIPAALQTSFSKYFSGQKLDFGWPFNQWLFWWMGSGWWGMLLFTAWFLFPAILGFKQKNIAVICWTIAIGLSCLIEVNLNYQYGVLLHVLPIAIFWKITTTSKVGNS